MDSLLVLLAIGLIIYVAGVAGRLRGRFSRRDTPTTPSLEFPFQAALEAMAVTSSYGDVIVTACKEPGGSITAPQCMLPHPKDKIKEAILFWLSLLARPDFEQGFKGLRNLAPAGLWCMPLQIPEDFDKEKLRQSLETGYVILGTFISDEDARFVITYMTAELSAVVAGGMFLPENEQSERFMKVRRAADEAVNELNAELDRFHREPWQVKWP